MTWYSSGRYRKRLNLHGALDISVSKCALWFAVVLYLQEIKLKEHVYEKQTPTASNVQQITESFRSIQHRVKCEYSEIFCLLKTSMVAIENLMGS